MLRLIYFSVEKYKTIKPQVFDKTSSDKPTGPSTNPIDNLNCKYFVKYCRSGNFANIHEFVPGDFKVLANKEFL